MIEVMLDTLTHRWLRIPYTLNVRYYRKPKKPRATILFIHGIGNTGDAWREVIAKMPADVRVITVDLLGFGNSPRPTWAMYDAKTQASSVLATYFKLGLSSRLIVVGHSLGSLVAIEMAKRYPLLIDSMVLCSPPLYDTSDAKTVLPRSDKMLRDLYRTAERYPGDFVRLSAFAMKYTLINPSFNVTAKNVDSYMATLGASIVNQSSYTDAYHLSTPTIMIRGSLDLLVIPKNLKRIIKANPVVRLRTIVAGHEIKGRYVNATVQAIHDCLNKNHT